MCVHTNTDQTQGVTSGGPTNEREAALRALGSARTALGDAIANYRVAFKTATTIGWSKADLTKAGFPDPVRLPKTSGRTPEAEA